MQDKGPSENHSSGLALSELFYQRELKPLLDASFPNLEYSAGLVGWGSEVLGYDDRTSEDHHWGPRAMIFVHDEDLSNAAPIIKALFASRLPYEFMGHSTNFSAPEPNGVRHAVRIQIGPVNHMVDVFSVESFCKMRLGFDPNLDIGPLDWLAFPQQRLLELVEGRVFHDGLHSLTVVRQKFAYFPHDIWRYLLAAQWLKVAQDEAFVGRTGDVGDDIGYKIVASRIMRELMRLCFLMERRYWPYAKWFGTAFHRLQIAPTLEPIFSAVAASATWKESETHLSRAYSAVAELHNSLALTEALPSAVSSYFKRPYTVIHADRFAAALHAQITDPEIGKFKLVGSIDQLTDSAEVLEDVNLSRFIIRACHGALTLGD